MEAIIDPVALPLAWDATWNQWKHLSGAKIGVEGTFVRTGNRYFRSGEWHSSTWWAALPSRLQITVPAGIHEQLETAKRIYHRFGQYQPALERIRVRLEREPLERRTLETLCAELGLPGDVDVAQISWKPDYDRFFYDQLRKRARKLYLLRAEFIMDLERAIVVEVPEVGHATYIFAKPADPDGFVAAYARVTKDDIRTNRGGAAERLGFIGRVMHGRNSRNWLRELRQLIGEAPEHALLPPAAD